jgi:predicted DNA-binding protein (MmcQ/YjbR family)
MFALSGINTTPVRITLKCDPELSRDLRASFESVEPGYHMNKEHWITVTSEGDLPADKLRWLIDHSYELVCASLQKSKQSGD